MPFRLGVDELTQTGAKLEEGQPRDGVGSCLGDDPKVVLASPEIGSGVVLATIRRSSWLTKRRLPSE